MPSEPFLVLVPPEALCETDAESVEIGLATRGFTVLANSETTLTLPQASELFLPLEGHSSYEMLVSRVSAGPILALALVHHSSAAVPPSDKPDDFIHVGELCSALGARADAHRELKMFFPQVLPAETATFVLFPAAVSTVPIVLEHLGRKGFLVLRQASLALSAAETAAAVGPAARAIRLSGGGDSSDSSGGGDGAMTTLFVVERVDASRELSSMLHDGPVAAAIADAVGNGGTVALASSDDAGARVTARRLLGSDWDAPSLTFTWLPPLALHQAPELIACAEAHGFRVVHSTALRPSAAQLSAIEQAPAPAPEVAHGDRGLALVLERSCAVQAWRSLLAQMPSATADVAAAEAVGAVAGATPAGGAASLLDVCHASRTPERARAEAAVFFPSVALRQTTVCVVLPHALSSSDGNSLGAIYAAAEAAGLVVTRQAHGAISADVAKALLAAQPRAYDGRADADASGDALVTSLSELTAELMAGESAWLALTGRDAIARWRSLLGPAHPADARLRCPTSLQARFGVDAARPLAYASQGEAAAAAELRTLFPNTQLVAPYTAPYISASTNAPAASPARPEAVDAAVMAALHPTLTKALVALAREKPPRPVEWLAHWLREHNPSLPRHPL